jgi:hypothetical protein
MKPQRRATPPVRGSGRAASKAREGARVEPGREMTGGATVEFTTEELLEFLEADRVPVEADPGFRERLREELWDLLERSRRVDGGRD